jgi:hypothetical protein
MTAETPAQEDWQRAFSALALIVREEYPAKYSLVEIAETWSAPTPADIKSLGIVEAYTAAAGEGSGR